MPANTPKEPIEPTAGTRERIPICRTSLTSTDSALAAAIERAKRPVGAFRSGRTDLAEKHDEAFAEILVEEMERRRLPESGEGSGTRGGRA